MEDNERPPKWANVLLARRVLIYRHGYTHHQIPSLTPSKQFFAIERINTIFRYFRAAPLSNISVLYATLLETCPKRPTA